MTNTASENKKITRPIDFKLVYHNNRVIELTNNQMNQSFPFTTHCIVEP